MLVTQVKVEPDLEPVLRRVGDLGPEGVDPAFDQDLAKVLAKMHDDDLLIINADHGCDPTFKGTDHTREYIPFLIYGDMIEPGRNLRTGDTFADSGETVRELLSIPGKLPIGESRYIDVYKASIANNH